MRLHKINRKQLLKIRFGNPFCEARKCYVVHNIVGYIAEQCYTLTLEHQQKLIDEGEWPCSRALRCVHKTELLLHRAHITLFRCFYMFNLCCWNARSASFRLWKIIQQRGNGQSECFYLAIWNVLPVWTCSYLYVTFTAQLVDKNIFWKPCSQNF